MVSPSAAGIDIEALRRDILRDLLQAGLDVSMHTDIGISDLSQPSPDEEEPDPTAKDDPDAE